WVGVWLLVFPNLLPMSQRRSILAGFLSAAVVPGMLLLSAAVHGVPASIRPWFGSIVLDFTIPTFICAAVSFFGSRVVYRLTRDRSRAREMGSYQLIDRIGSGGMGEVWRAKHRMLVRPAAVKLIRPQMLGGEDASKTRAVVRRFEREAQATAA